MERAEATVNPETSHTYSTFILMTQQLVPKSDFCNGLASLQQLKCLICLKRCIFPSVFLMMQIAVHDRYHNDTHVPKLFSAANYFIVSLLNNSYFYLVEHRLRGTSHLHGFATTFNDSDPDSEWVTPQMMIGKTL